MYVCIWDIGAREKGEALTFHAARPMMEPRSGGTSSMPSRRIMLDRGVAMRGRDVDAGGAASGEVGVAEGGCHEVEAAVEGEGMAVVRDGMEKIRR